VTILIMSIAWVSGCTESNPDREKFIGTWQTGLKNNPIGEGNYTDTRTFYANGSYSSTNMGIGTIPGTWYLSQGKLIIDTYFPGTYAYRFSENNTVLTLTSETRGFTEYLTRQ
jgi:hypothetical protein